MPAMLSDGEATGPRLAGSGQLWIDLPIVNRHTLADVARRVGLPLELITYCLLPQRQPKVVPCAAWLYCAWQVPVFSPGPSVSDEEATFRFVEIKVCLGPAAVVTTQGRVRRTRAALTSLLPEGSDVIRERASNVLVTVAERIADAYMAAHEEVAVRSSGGERGGARRDRERSAVQARLLRHGRAHREAIEKLIARGQRWLDAREIERLQTVTRRLGALGIDPAPIDRDPGAV